MLLRVDNEVKLWSLQHPRADIGDMVIFALDLYRSKATERHDTESFEHIKALVSAIIFWQNLL